MLTPFASFSEVTILVTRSLVVAAAAALASPVFAQPNPAATAAKARFGMISGVLAKTAEKVPENLYAFTATSEVRSIAPLSATPLLDATR